MMKKNRSLFWFFLFAASAANVMLVAKLDMDFDAPDLAPEKQAQPEQAPPEQAPPGLAPQQLEQPVIPEQQNVVPGEQEILQPKIDSDVYLEELRPSLRAAAQDIERKEERKKKKRQREKKEEPLIEFNFKDAKLTDLINEVAAKKGINIVLPQGAKALKTTITFELEKKVPLSVAEQYMYTMLELAGYTMYPTDGFFVIDKKPENAETVENREPYHLYVNIAPDELPHSSENIHAIYYLSNLQVPKAQYGTDTLSNILREMVGQKKYLFDEKSNGIIITGPADKIASAMTIILELDAAGSPEAVEIFPLFNANAADVAKILREQVIKAIAKAPAQPAGKVALPEGTGTYFAPGTRIIADSRTNSLILVGTESALTRIRDFVREYMDQLPESGRSILHSYDLQYLDASKFVDTLNAIITQSKTGQATQDSVGGAHRLFDTVIVQAEKPEESSSAAPAGKTVGTVKLGGNRLIIAAQHDDYQRIVELIQQLDKPQLQVVVEVVILDINVTGTRLLQSQLRNLTNIPLHEDLQFQTANITYPFFPGNNALGQITSEMASPANNPPVPRVPVLATDLLELLTGTGTTPRSGAPLTTPGTMLLSFKDPCTNAIAALLAILDRWVEKKVISHPFLVTKNNVKARQFLKTIRQGAGRDVSSGGTTTVKIEDFTATIAIEVTPRISSLDRLALQIRVDIEDFINPDPTTFSRTTRRVETNAHMNTGQILILGGLTQEQDSETVTKVPILGDIPLLGVLFRGQSKIKTKNNLVVLIHPTVVNPKLRAGQRVYTDDIVSSAHAELQADTLFSATKDPITRFFFNVGNTGDAVLTNYLEEVKYNKDVEGQAYRTVEQHISEVTEEPSEIQKTEKVAAPPQQKRVKTEAKQELVAQEQENIRRRQPA